EKYLAWKRTAKIRSLPLRLYQKKKLMQSKLRKTPTVNAVEIKKSQLVKLYVFIVDENEDALPATRDLATQDTVGESDVLIVMNCGIEYRSLLICPTQSLVTVISAILIHSKHTNMKRVYAHPLHLILLLIKPNMSSKPAHNMSFNDEQTQSEEFPNSLETSKLHTSNEVIQPKTVLYLDELTDGASGDDYCDDLPLCTLLQDGNAIHSTTKANVAHNFLTLKEGSVYSIKNFVVQDNKEEYRIFRDHACMIELDGATSVRKTPVKGGGFVRYPFQLKELGSIELTGNKYLIRNALSVQMFY
nr:hypothetical protein [Tanacetum cinerariifolium]